MLIKKLFKLKITTQFKPAVFKLKFELNFNVYYKHVLKDTICKYCYCILSFYSLNLLFYSFFFLLHLFVLFVVNFYGYLGRLLAHIMMNSIYQEFHVF